MDCLLLRERGLLYKNILGKFDFYLNSHIMHIWIAIALNLWLSGIDLLVPHSISVATDSKFPFLPTWTPWTISNLHADFLVDSCCIKVRASLQDPKFWATVDILTTAYVHLRVFTNLKDEALKQDLPITWRYTYQFHNLVMERVAPIIEVVIENCWYSRMGEYISVSLKIEQRLRTAKIQDHLKGKGN